MSSLACARERLVKQALLCAAEALCQKAEDPGWNSEYLDDQLDTAAHEYLAAKAFKAPEELPIWFGPLRDAKKRGMTLEEAWEKWDTLFVKADKASFTTMWEALDA